MVEIQSLEDVQSGFIRTLMEREEEELEKLILKKVSLQNSNKARDKEKLKKVEKKIKAFSKAPELRELNETKEYLLPTVSNYNDHVLLSSGLQVPKAAWDLLLPHQQIGIEWLHKIHKSGTGCLLGDEMGLGKTVMVSVFLQALKDTYQLNSPILIICPATLIAQWKMELEKWVNSIPIFDYKSSKSSVSSVNSPPYGILLITYEILHTQHKALQKPKWLYVILDEGHKIKNPNCTLTKLCKEFKNFHRLILSGTPIQNSLSELWSLFDFICPGLLGTQDVFDKEFADRINRAGYSSSNEVQVETAYQCAVQLRELINPYILRRTKKEVNIGIPDHQEKILYCELEQSQWEVYENYIHTIIDQGDFDHCVAIKDLRFICNHPKMLKSHIASKIPIPANVTSGKLIIMKSILTHWTESGHHIVIFSQYKKMLDLTQEIVESCGFSYGRIDGDLHVSKRMPEIDKFNQGVSRVLLLTTKVGGLGINLPKASRVILLDPDWNPMNDNQAKERALRIGQKTNLIIYRFVTKGTIEEKIYNRQIFKTMIADKVRFMQILINPDQKQFFQHKELRNLFEVPPKPQESDEIETCDLPKKRKRLNEFIEVVINNDVEMLNAKDSIQNAHFSRIGELNRIKQHARE